MHDLNDLNLFVAVVTHGGFSHMVFTSRRGQLPGVRAVIDFLAEALDTSAPAWEAAR